MLTPFGSNAKGAQSWYQLPFGLQFQPSEIAKFGLIVALAGYVNEHRGDIDPWRLTVIIGLALVPLALVQLQPDLGTNMVLICIVLGLLAVGGVKGRYLGVIALLGITGIYSVISLGILKQYQLDRLTTPYESSSSKRLQGAAYNQDQSVKTIGTGGLTGAGLFKGPQTRLGFVPEQQTDFIFTAVGEELGFVGAAALLALFVIVMWRTWRTARLAPRLLRHACVRWRPGDVHVHDLREHRHDDGDHARHGHPAAVHELRRVVVDHVRGMHRPRQQRLREPLQLGPSGLNP